MNNRLQNTDEEPTKEIQSVLKINEENGPPCRFHFFHVYFTTGYYLCLVPFRPVKNVTSGAYQLHTNSIQKFLCYGAWTLIMLGQITSIRTTWVLGISKHPVIWYFELVHAHSHACMYLTMFTTLYLKSSEISGMLNQISHSSLLKCSGKTWWIVIGAHIFWVILGLIAPVIGYEIIDSKNWSFNFLVKSYAKVGRHTFFGTSEQEDSIIIGSVDIIYACLQFLVSVAHNFQLFTIAPLLGCCSVTIWSATSMFVNETMESKNICIEAISQQFKELKQLANSINSVWNLFCIWYLMDIVAWYSTELDAGLVSEDWFVKLDILYYLFCYTTLMVLSADSFRKIGCLRQWLSGKNDEEMGGSLEGLERDMNNAVIGIGSKGFYEFNYSFLSQVTVVIITYFIISVDKANDRE